jgi:hypothetical protein
MRLINTILYKLKLKRPNPQLNRADLLDVLPLRNKLIEWKVDDKGEVALVIPQKNTLWVKALSKLFMLPGKRVVVLDDVGSFVWQLCDGYHSINQIVKQLSGKYQMTRKEAETSLITFMRQLGKRGMVGFAAPKNTKGGKK